MSWTDQNHLMGLIMNNNENRNQNSLTHIQHSTFRNILLKRNHGNINEKKTNNLYKKSNIISGHDML